MRHTPTGVVCSVHPRLTFEGCVRVLPAAPVAAREAVGANAVTGFDAPVLVVLVPAARCARPRLAALVAALGALDDVRVRAAFDAVVVGAFSVTVAGRCARVGWLGASSASTSR